VPAEPVPEGPAISGRAGQVTLGEQAEHLAPARGARRKTTVAAAEPDEGGNLPGYALIQGVILSVVLGPPRAFDPYRPGAPGGTRGS